MRSYLVGAIAGGSVAGGLDLLGGLALPGGSRDIVLGVLMVVVLLVRPDGLIRGREFTTPPPD